jgi:hypothetical protein
VGFGTAVFDKMKLPGCGLLGSAAVQVSGTILQLLFFLLFGVAFFTETGLLTGGSVLVLPGLLNCIFLLTAVLALRGYVGIVTVACLVLSVALAIVLKLPLADFFSIVNKSSSIIPFMLAVPLVSLPIRRGGYLEAVGALAGRSKQGDPNRYCVAVFGQFLSLSFLQFLMAVVLNIGAIPVMRNLLVNSRLETRNLARIHSSGYSAYMVAAPFDGLILSLILAAGSSYAAYIPYGLAMLGLIFLVGALLAILGLKAPPIEVPDNAASAKMATAPGINKLPLFKLLGLVLHIVVMICLAALVNRYIVLKNPALGSAVVIGVYALGWDWWIRSRVSAAANSENLIGLRDWLSGLLAFRGFLPFLISAGMLAALLARTPFRSILIALAASLDFLPLYWTLLVLMSGTALLGLCGIHMMISVSAMAAAFSPASLGLGAEGFALFLLSTWLVTMNLSPFSPFSVVVAEATGSSPLRVALHYNRNFALLMLFAAPALIVLIG